MPTRTKDEELRSLGSCYEVLSAAVEYDRKSTKTLKMQREALRRLAAADKRREPSE